MSENIKKKFIDCVYHIIETEGVSAVSVRRVSREVGCNSAILYRQFQNMEHLICLASIKYLEPYLVDIATCTRKIRNPVELNYKLWESFCRYSFTNPEIFEMLFFGQFKDNLMDIMYDYFDIYQDQFSELDGFSVSFLFSSDIFERDYMFFRRGANMGYVSEAQTRNISRMEVYMYHGMLQECKENKYKGEELEQKIQEFLTYQKILAGLIKSN